MHGIVYGNVTDNNSQEQSKCPSTMEQKANFWYIHKVMKINEL